MLDTIINATIIVAAIAIVIIVAGITYAAIATGAAPMSFVAIGAVWILIVAAPINIIRNW